MKTMLLQNEKSNALYFQDTPRVSAGRESLENQKLRTVETYFFERLGPDYNLPHTKFPASFFKALSPLFLALEREHPDWIYKHYLLVSHTETPANEPGEADIYFYILLEDPRSSRLLVEFFQKHLNQTPGRDKFINEVRKQADMMERVYQDFARHQVGQPKPRYFIINTSAL